MKKTTLEDIGRMAVEVHKLVAQRTRLRRRDRDVERMLWPDDHWTLVREIGRAKNTLGSAARRYVERQKGGS